MASSDSQIDKPQRGRPKRAELPDVNINTGVQSINTESGFFKEASKKSIRYWTTSQDYKHRSVYDKDHMSELRIKKIQVKESFAVVK